MEHPQFALMQNHGHLEQPEDAEITELIRQQPRVLQWALSTQTHERNQSVPASQQHGPASQSSNASSQTGPVTNLHMHTTEKHQLRKEPLPKTTTLHFVIKFVFCHLLLSGT